MPVELCHGGNELLAGLWSLDQCMPSHDPNRGPAPPGVLHDIALGSATGSGDKTARVWSVPGPTGKRVTVKERAVLKDHSDAVEAVATEGLEQAQRQFN